MANESRSISNDGLAKLRAYEAEIDGLYEDQSGYCTAGVGHLVHPGEKWGCFLLGAADGDDAFAGSTATKWPGKPYELTYLRRQTAFGKSFGDLKTKALDAAKEAVAQRKHGKAFGELTPAKQASVTASAQAAIDEQARVLAKTPEELLRADLPAYESAVRQGVTVSLTQAEYDALVSLCWNIGPGAFAGSSVVKEINKDAHRAGTVERRTEAIRAIEQAFAKYDKSGGVVLDALKRRRKQEADDFLQESRFALDALKTTRDLEAWRRHGHVPR